MSNDLPQRPDAQPVPPKSASRIGTWGWAIMPLIVVAVVALIVPAARQAMEARRRTACKGHLKQIALALHEYHDKYGSLPPAYTVGPNGEKLHSWRSLILPFLGEADLYSQVRWDEPWNSRHNGELSQRHLDIYTCPSASHSVKGRTNYFAVVDRVSAWPERYAVKVGDVLDGTSNTILLVEANIGNVNWMQPQDVSRSEALASMEGDNHQAHSHEGGLHIAMCDGAARFIRRGIDRKILASLVSINGGAPYPGVEWPDMPDVREPEFSDPGPSGELQQTEVWPVTDRKIVPGKTIVYCCSFQMAWGRARQFANGAPIELEGDSLLATQLNAQSFPICDLSEPSYVANAGLGKGVVPLIKEELNRKFPKFSSKFLEQADNRRFVAYAYLYKNLPFHVSFDRLTKPLTFENAKVASFGIADVDRDDVRHEQLGAQVSVLDYVSDDDFIVRLIPRGGSDEILLAKLLPEKTLAETINVVRERVTKPNGSPVKPQLQSGESLVVPVLSLNVERVFAELLGRTFKTAGLSDLYVGDARQILRFRLDENGAKVESEAFFVGDNGHDHPPPPPKPRKLVFDKPFLIWLRETQASEPYFAAWINNTELMELMSR